MVSTGTLNMGRLFGAAMESLPAFAGQLMTNTLSEISRAKQTKEQLFWQAKERERLIDIEAKKAIGSASAATRRGNVIENTFAAYISSEVTKAKQQITSDYERDVRNTRIFGLF